MLDLEIKMLKPGFINKTFKPDLENDSHTHVYFLFSGNCVFMLNYYIKNQTVLKFSHIMICNTTRILLRCKFIRYERNFHRLPRDLPNYSISYDAMKF